MKTLSNSEINDEESLSTIFGNPMNLENDCLRIWENEHDLSFNELVAEEVAQILFDEYMSYFGRGN
ncbi:MAG: hypothetical protein WCJ95_20850 [Mariniphaga sp.]